MEVDECLRQLYSPVTSPGDPFRELYVTAQVARRRAGGLLLVNRVPHREETRAFFGEMYASFLRRPERSDFLELFSIHQDFYAVFRYNEGPSLAASTPGVPARRASACGC